MKSSDLEVLIDMIRSNPEVFDAFQEVIEGAVNKTDACIDKLCKQVMDPSADLEDIRIKSIDMKGQIKGLKKVSRMLSVDHLKAITASLVKEASNG